MKIKFCGAAEGVTGSCHLISTGNYNVLLDCGMFQGGKKEVHRNYEPFPFDPASIDYVILSHAHIDHCGRLPLLVRAGFKGKIYCTDATADLLPVMLEDSGHIQEKEAEWQNRKNERAGRRMIEPLYTVADAEAVLKYIEPVLYNQLVELNESLKIVFNDAGHILGSAITELWVTEDGKTSKIVFSGDLGVMNRPILKDPTIIKSADYVIMETTYGNRIHPQNQTSVQTLLDIVIKTIRRGGTVVIPSFAVGRTQELIYEFNRFYAEHPEYKKELDSIYVYIDSPMAATSTQIFRENAQVFDEETREYILKGNNPLDFPNLKFTKTTDESRLLNFDNNAKVIISASGMCEAGRIRHHLKHNLWDAKNSVIFVGYQAEGTLGRMILDGAKEVALFGEVVRVNAEIYNLEGFSAHADMNDLLAWLAGFRNNPKHVFLVHGEPDAKRDFAHYVKESLDYDCVVVQGISEYTLEHDEIVSAEKLPSKKLDEEEIETVRERISAIHDDLEKILYNTHLAVDANTDPEKLMRINNLILAIEKETINLGSAVTAEDSNDITPEDADAGKAE